MRSYLLALLITLFMLLGCETTKTPTADINNVPAPVIFNHFEPANKTAIETNTQTDKHNKPTIKLQPEPQAASSDATIVKQSADLWQYIATNLEFKIYLNKALNKRIQWYIKQPTYLKTVNKRAAPYLYHIVRKIEQQDLPMEIALLPFVESDFRPRVSSSQQAVGVWQLVGATAYHFGINSDQWYDGRRDVLAATDAALAYLKYLHKRFDGNWLHALAAYNSGEGRVKRAIADNKNNGKSTDYWSLKLPKETSEYVPKLLALSYLVQNPQLGLQRPKLANKALTTEFNVGQQFDFSVIASLSGIGRKQLHTLNPGYLKNQSSPNGPHTLLLPLEQQSLLRSQFFKSNFSGEYIVQKDDTLYSISRRFDLSVKKLKMMNNKTSNLIGIGEALIVGQPRTMPDSLTIDYKISPYLEQTEVAIPTVAIEYQVKPGDTIWGISQLYDVPHKDLAQWNQLSASSILKPGSKLVLHLPQATKPISQLHNQGMLSGLEKTLKQPH
ncbi:transglycosylase SLT domain-containing protein [Pseudoalteromonas shioyasakiensis]|uniref:transglycosylase SLT domain-containing protein n=1 Tax=Pseudoalteromonas shioyasakiensis TaxID=1190813 RepID=UPI0021185C27|nr:transglycosylase SLT domain-containing protein [Pseudoalteromonas shioyasakiensis]MCQ8879395.1 transglycosylase SLT domain-containing protein [Pseudoalteromonas shioyasakiensis]